MGDETLEATEAEAMDYISQQPSAGNHPVTTDGSSWDDVTQLQPTLFDKINGFTSGEETEVGSIENACILILKTIQKKQWQQRLDI